MGQAVAYALTIDGTPASADVLEAIQQIDVEEDADLAAMLRLRLACAVRRDGRGWTLVDDGLFARLARLKLSVTVGSGPAIPVIDAYVIETDGRFSNDPNGSTLTVTAMDTTVLMHLEEKVKAWPNMKDSDVASAVFSDPDYRLTPVVEDTGWTRKDVEQTLVQRGTDIQFLRHLAERNGYECFVEVNPSSGDAEGHFHPPRQSAPPQGVLTVNMGSATNVNAFRVRFDMLGATAADATTLDVEAGTPQPGQASATSRGDLGRDSAAATDRPRRVLLSGLAMAQSGETQRYAQAVVDRAAWAIHAEGDLNIAAYGGLLRARRPVLVRGVGRDLSGAYYAQRVLLGIAADGTCIQRFRLRRNATGLTGREQFQQTTALPAG